jgi:hypothetical protein
MRFCQELSETHFFHPLKKYSTDWEKTFKFPEVLIIPLDFSKRSTGHAFRFENREEKKKAEGTEFSCRQGNATIPLC